MVDITGEETDTLGSRGWYEEPKEEPPPLSDHLVQQISGAVAEQLKSSSVAVDFVEKVTRVGLAHPGDTIVGANSFYIVRADGTDTVLSVDVVTNKMGLNRERAIPKARLLDPNTHPNYRQILHGVPSAVANFLELEAWLRNLPDDEEFLAESISSTDMVYRMSKTAVLQALGRGDFHELPISRGIRPYAETLGNSLLQALYEVEPGWTIRLKTLIPTPEGLSTRLLTVSEVRSEGERVTFCCADSLKPAGDLITLDRSSLQADLLDILEIQKPA